MTLYRIEPDWQTEYYEDIDEVLEHTESCQEHDHVQQVAYSTFERAFTQICFHCKKVRTTR